MILKSKGKKVTKQDKAQTQNDLFVIFKLLFSFL